MRPSLEDEAVGTCLLVKMEHPEGTIYAATSLAPIEWDGQTWAGLGLVTDIQGLEESSKVEVHEITFTLPGVPDNLIAGLSASVKGHEATVWHTLLDASGRVVGEPEIITIADLDGQDYNFGEDGTATINITGYSAIMDVRDPPGLTYTPEFQREQYEDDIGLDRIPAFVDRVASWTAT
jgi:hypothetical protein